MSPEDTIETTAETADLELAILPILPDKSPNIKQKENDQDPYLVVFKQPIDPDNPLDWPTSRKWMVTDVLSATGFNRIMVSTILAPALSKISTELHMNSTESAMTLSIYLLATAFGPLVIGPLSEIYGRQVVLHASSIWFLIWNIVCGFAKTKGTLIAARFLAGFGASAIYSLGAGVLGDVWRPSQRGKSLGIYWLIPLLGLAVGPIIGGFITQRTTWRWMFWSTSIFQAVMIFVSIFSFHETFGPTILQRRAARLRKETGNASYYTKNEKKEKGMSTLSVLARTMSRPARLLVFHPLIQVSAILSAFNYGITYVVLSTFSDLWTQKYGHSVEISGLHYIALALGEVVGSQVGGGILDYSYNKAKTQDPPPEFRLPYMLPFVLISWPMLLVYGWLAQYQIYWFAVDVFVFLMMAGMQAQGLPLSAYIIDVYGEHTSSAMSAQQFARSLTAFLFPLFAPPMYRALGYGWSNSIMALAGFMLAIPLPLFVWKYGARLRAKAISTY